MKFNNFAVIVTAPGLDPKVHRAVIKTDSITYTTIGVDSQHKEQVIEVAKEAVASGAQILELCGGFGPIWMAKVIEALKGAVPVGGVFYGPEARKPLVDLGLVHTLKFDTPNEK
jgi:hypothetical protein